MDMTAPSQESSVAPTHVLPESHVEQDSTNQHPTVAPLEPEDLPYVPLPWKNKNSSSAKPTSQKQNKTKKTKTNKHKNKNKKIQKCSCL